MTAKSLDIINDPKSLSLFALIISGIIAGPGSWLFKNYYNSRVEFERETEQRITDLENRRAENLETFISSDEYYRTIINIQQQIDTIEARQYEQFIK